jgi:Holliday junction resolvase
MSTPEKKVKERVKTILRSEGVYFFMPATYGYGSSGVPDIVACLDGSFVGIECKANGNKPTQLQMTNLMNIAETGGIAFVVDEHTVDLFGSHIKSLRTGGGGGIFWNLQEEMNDTK